MDIIALVAQLDTLLAIIILLWRIMRQDTLVTALLLHALADDDTDRERYAAKILGDMLPPRLERSNFDTGENKKDSNPG